MIPLFHSMLFFGQMMVQKPKFVFVVKKKLVMNSRRYYVMKLVDITS